MCNMNHNKISLIIKLNCHFFVTPVTLTWCSCYVRLTLWYQPDSRPNQKMWDIGNENGHRSRQWILWSRVVYHSGWQPTPHLGHLMALKQKDLHVRIVLPSLIACEKFPNVFPKVDQQSALPCTTVKTASKRGMMLLALWGGTVIQSKGQPSSYTPR